MNDLHANVCASVGFTMFKQHHALAHSLLRVSIMEEAIPTLKQQEYSPEAF